jgi:hypothetical protein
MLPRETSVRQLKKLRAETKGTDIGDLTTKDRLNMPVPNMQAIGNPVDTGIESWEDFSNKDSKLQTIAFKSKLVNKPLVKENKKETKNMIENIKTFDTFLTEGLDNAEESGLYDDMTELLIQANSLYCNYNGEDPEECEISDPEEAIDLLNEIEEDHELYSQAQDLIDSIAALNDDIDSTDAEEYFNDDDDDDDDDDYLEESIKTFESFSVKSAPKEEKQPEYTILGKEKEPKSNPNFGIGAVKSEEIKTIGSFTDFTKLIDPVTPKERTIGGNAGVFIDNDIVKGYVNRIDGKDVYVESLEDPLVIKKFSLKDAVKLPKEKKD